MSDLSRIHFVGEYLPGDDARVELRNGRFVDVVNGTYHGPEVSLIVEGGKIQSMPGLPGEPGDIRPDFTIDLQGKTILPGLFNTHCHINVAATTIVPSFRDIRLNKRYADRQKAKDMAECLAHGITNIRDAFSEDLRPTVALKERIARGELPGPRIIQSVIVGPPGSYLAEKYGIVMRSLRSALGLPAVEHSRRESGVVEFPVEATESQVRDAVDRAVDERGAEAIKIGEQRENMANLKPDSTIMTINQLEALADQARRRGLKTLMHHVSVDSFRRGVKAGVSTLSHIATDAALSKEDVTAFKEAGCIIEPTVSVAYGITWKVKGDEWYDHPEMERLTAFRNGTYTYAAMADEYYIPELRDSVVGSYARLSTGKFKLLGVVSMSRVFRYYARSVAHGFDNLRLLVSEGASIALANDGGVPPCTPAMMGLELTFFDLALNQEPGGNRLNGVEALRIATIKSARSMGLEAEFGSIESGKVADLVVVDGDPIEDFRVLGSRAAALFMDGRLVIDNCGLQIEAAEA
ncbi:amidohydrolase family protein [Chloroflexota bacterium]